MSTGTKTAIDAVARAQSNTTVVLKAMQEPGTQSALAHAMGVSESTISRMKTEQLEQLCLMLAHLGLKVVPEGHQGIPSSYIDALMVLARHGLNSVQSVRDIDFEGV